MEFILFLCLSSIVLFFNKAKDWLIEKYGSKDIQTFLKRTESTLIVLLLWSIIGFYLNLDHNQDSGCLSHSNYFSSENIQYSFISISMFILAYLLRNKGELGGYLLILEGLFWLWKLFFIKGGYAVGYEGSPDLSVLLYDIIACYFRISLWLKLYQIQYKTQYLWTTSLLILFVKLVFT